MAFHAQPQPTMRPMTTKIETNKFRMTARVVGAVYLAGFAVGIAGNLLSQSSLGGPNRLAMVSTSGMTVALGAILWLLAVVGDAAHGVLMFPVLRPHNERIAVGYLAARIADAMFVAIMVLLALVQIPLAREYATTAAADASVLQAISNVAVQTQLYAYEFGMITLGISGLLLCTTLHRAQLLPRWLAVWGLIGYAVILVGMVSAVLGTGLGDISSIPGGLWEVFTGVWLIVKGFNVSTIAAKPLNDSFMGEAASAPAA